MTDDEEVSFEQNLIKQGEELWQFILSDFVLMDSKSLAVMLPPAPNQLYTDKYNEEDMVVNKKHELNRKRTDYDAECIVFKALEKLGMDIIVLHNLSYSQKQSENFIDGKPSSGEHDFVVLVPGQALVIIEVKNPLCRENSFKHARTSASTQVDQFKRLFKGISNKTEESCLRIVPFLAFPNLDRNCLCAAADRYNGMLYKEDIRRFSKWWEENVSSQLKDIPKECSDQPNHVSLKNVTLSNSEKILFGLWYSNFRWIPSRPKNGLKNVLNSKQIIASTLYHIHRMLDSQTYFFDIMAMSNSLVKVDKIKYSYFKTSQAFRQIKYITKDQENLLDIGPNINVIVNGPAGSGKTVIMHARILKLLRDKGQEEQIAVLVPWQGAAEKVEYIVKEANGNVSMKIMNLVTEIEKVKCEPARFAEILKRAKDYDVIIFVKPNFLMNLGLTRHYSREKLIMMHKLFINLLESEKMNLFCDDFHNSIAYSIIDCQDDSRNHINFLSEENSEKSFAHSMLNFLHTSSNSQRMLWIGFDLIQIVQSACWGTGQFYKEIPECIKELFQNIQNTHTVCLSTNLRNTFSIAELLGKVREIFMKTVGYLNMKEILPDQGFQHFIRGFTPSLYCVLGKNSMERTEEVIRKELNVICKSLKVCFNCVNLSCVCQEPPTQCIGPEKTIAVIPVYNHLCFIDNFSTIGFEGSFEAFKKFKDRIRFIVDSSIPEKLKDNGLSVFVDNVKYSNSLEFPFALLILDLTYDVNKYDESHISENEKKALLNVLAHLYLGVSRAKVWCSIIIMCSNDTPSRLYSHLCEILDPYVKRVEFE